MVLRTFTFIAFAICILIVKCHSEGCVSKKLAISVSSTDSESSSNPSNAEVSISKTKRPCRNKKCQKVIKCKENEEIVQCIEWLPRPQYCSQRDQTLWTDENPKCTEGCVCKEDYLRNNNGTCVPEEECDSDCGDNEVLDTCPSDCPTDYCPTREGESTACFRPDQDVCPPPICKCKFNYRRALNGTCISTIDCPPFDCSARPNEEFNPCPPLCPTDDCSQATPSGDCPKQFGNILIVLPCAPKCRCKKGYWRKNGICVPYNKCPNICPANEEYSKCKQLLCRKQKCSDRSEKSSCPRVDPKYCKTGCVCKKNFFRNKNGTCVPEDKCDEQTQATCGVNEVLDKCPSDCPSDYCPKSEDDNQKCGTPTKCPPPACKCRFNYRRAENGSCIPTKDCPPFDCSDEPNEQYTPCPPICPSDSCSLPRVRGICPYNIKILLECNPKCQCKDGYGRLDNGTCVPFEECPDFCPENQEYNSCTQAICRPLTCSNRSGRINCPMVRESSCKRDCVCKKDYYKNDKVVCVSVDECEVAPVCPNPNEEYQSTRIPNCPLLGTCTSIVARIACDQPEVPSCVCKGGYLRLNETSPCIPTCECPQLKHSPECLKDYDY